MTLDEKIEWLHMEICVSRFVWWGSKKAKTYESILKSLQELKEIKEKDNG